MSLCEIRFFKGKQFIGTKYLTQITINYLLKDGL